jgi:signal transduction histidine kinase
MSGQSSLPSSTAALTGLRSALRTAPGFQVSVYVEHVYVLASGGEDDERRLRDGLRAKYAGLRLDAIAVWGFPATRFLARWGGDLWPGVPGVAFGVDERLLAGSTPPPPVALIPMRFDVEGTVRLALTLLPETRQVALFSGASPGELRLADLYRADLRAFGNRLELIDLTGLPLEDLLRQVAVLPDRTILLGSSYEGDGRGRAFFWADIAPAIAAAANGPIFTPVSSAMGAAVVGGSMVDLGEQGEEAGRAILKVLAGAPVAARVSSEVRPRVVADWDRLQRWRLDETRLPPGSRVLNRVPTLWERYRGQVLAAITLLFGLSLAIVGLVFEQQRRRRAQAALEDRLRFEELVTEVSSLTHSPASGLRGPGPGPSVPAGSFEERVRESLRRIAGALGADGAGLWPLSGEGPAGGAVAWPEEIAAAPSGAIPLDGVPFSRTRALAGETVRLRTLDELPPEAAVDRQTFARRGVRSLLAVPLDVGGGVTCAVCCLTFQRERAWSDETVHRLRMVGEVLAGALARARAEGELRASEALSRAVLASLPSEVAVIDRDGVILHVNEQWTAFARDHGAEGCPKVSVGASYLEVCRRAARMGDSTAARALGIIEAVLGGEDGGETLEYFAGVPGQDRWFEMSVRRLEGARGAALIVHRDVTAAKRTAEEVRQALVEIAHLDRVAAVGELASSLAHELNQPLSAILANAQAARRWLGGASPDLGEIQAVLDDIVADDQRAAEVIRRIRALLRKGQPRKDLVDLNEIVRETIRLVSSDALLRGASIAADLPADLPKIRADGIQLQQVLLNLLVNGLHAITDAPAHRRRIVVRTASTDRSVEVAVQDGGRGIPEGDLGRIFEPFFTTKREGLGIGLAISRSIVEAHAGQIGAENDPDGGAIFQFRLPLERPASGPPTSRG